MRRLLVAAGLLSLFASVGLQAAQWLNYRAPGVPRMADGKRRLDAPAPSTAIPTSQARGCTS